MTVTAPVHPAPAAVPAVAPQPGTVVPTWVPTPQGALAASVHLPYGPQCRGAVILLPPTGRAETTLRPGLRALADRLARHDCVVVRPDWSGTVESAAPLHDDGAVPPMARRLGDVAALAAYCQDTLGQRDLTLVGAGLGATLAALALGDPRGPRPDAHGATPYRSLVLLDPAAGHDPWLRLPAARPASAAGTRILLVSREEAPAEQDVEDYALRVGADRLDAIDLDALDVTATDPVIPVDTWAVVTQWLALPTRCATPVPTPPAARRTVVGEAIVEEYVEVGGLPGVLTSPVGPSRHALLVIGDEDQHRGGPGGDGWVRLARAAAREGVSTLRFDRSGAGEAGLPGYAASALISGTSLAEHVSAVEWLAARTGRRPAIAGYGAGAWVALATAGRVPVARVVSVAQDDWSSDPGAAAGLHPWLVAHLPYAAVLRLGRTRALATPQPLLEAATARGAAVDVYGDARHAARFAALRGEQALARLREGGAAVRRYTEADGLDLRDPGLLDVMLGRVLGRLLRDVSGTPEARVAHVEDGVRAVAPEALPADGAPAGPSAWIGETRPTRVARPMVSPAPRYAPA